VSEVVDPYTHHIVYNTPYIFLASKNASQIRVRRDLWLAFPTALTLGGKLEEVHDFPQSRLSSAPGYSLSSMSRHTPKPIDSTDGC